MNASTFATLTLGLWLLLTGLIPLLHMVFPYEAPAMAILAVLSGALLLFGAMRRRSWF